MRLERFFLLLLFSLSLTFPAFAQDKKTDDKDNIIKIDTRLVEHSARRHNICGTPVKGLKAANFVVYEDGKKQEIVDFSATTAPFEVALVLDTSGSARNDLPLIQRAARDLSPAFVQAIALPSSHFEPTERRIRRSPQARF